MLQKFQAPSQWEINKSISSGSVKKVIDKTFVNLSRFKKWFNNAVNDWYKGTSEDFAKALTKSWYTVDWYSKYIKSKAEYNFKKKELDKKKSSWLFKNIVGGALESAKWIPKIGAEYVWLPIVKGIAKIAWKDEEQVEDIEQSYREEVLDETFGDNESIAFKGTKFLGDIAQTATVWSVAKNAIKGTALWTKLAQSTKALEWTWKAGKLASKVIRWAIQWADEVAIYDAIANQEVATAKELWIWAWIGGALPLLWAVVNKLWKESYNAAFKQVKQSLSEESIERLSKKAGETVADEWLKWYSISSMKKEIGEQMSETYKTLQAQANKAQPIPVKELWTSLKGDIKNKLLSWLNKNTGNYKAISENIDDIVDFYVWTSWEMWWKEGVRLVKELNSIIPASASKKWEIVLNPQQSKTVIKSLKNSIQKYLDDEVGDIIKLYWDYSRKKLVQDILKNTEVKKMMWRSLIWATVWWVSWSTEAFARWDIWWGIKQAVVWALIWWLAVRAATSPTTLSNLWKVLTQGSKMSTTWIPALWEELIWQDDDTE